jgi:hypothetical protein
VEELVVEFAETEVVEDMSVEPSERLVGVVMFVKDEALELVADPEVIVDVALPVFVEDRLAERPEPVDEFDIFQRSNARKRLDDIGMIRGLTSVFSEERLDIEVET